MRTLVLLSLVPVLWSAEDPSEIVRRAVKRDEKNWALARNYTFLERTEERDLDGSGQVRKRSSKTYDVTLLEGTPYRRLVEREDRPLKPSEVAEEQRKLEKSIENRKRESEEERRARLADWEKKRKEQREAILEMPNAFDLTLLGTELLAGRRTYMIQAIPKPGYHSENRIARFFPKVRGRMWIDAENYQWVRADAEVIDTISIGWFLARISQGTRFSFQQVLVNNEVWLPSRLEILAAGRIVLLRKIHTEIEISYRNYRKFQTDSRILSAQPVQ